MITKEREDYLKTIYALQWQESPVRTTTIARALNVEPASVTGAIKRLAELLYVEYEPYRGVTLTPEGERIALEVLRHHRLIELYLVHALGYSWDEVHDEAERLEHAVSPLFIERIAAVLGYPELDPHGAPIPNKDGTIAIKAERALVSLAAGDSGEVSRVEDHDPELLRHLAEIGIRPGAVLKVQQIDPFGGSLTIEVNGQGGLSLGPQAAEQVFMRGGPA